jgi:hypothetical protein
MSIRRKRPYRHPVRGHHRGESHVRPYERGQGYPVRRLPRRVVAPWLPAEPELPSDIGLPEVIEVETTEPEPLTEVGREGRALVEELESIERLEESLPVLEDLVPEGEDPEAAIDFESIGQRLELVSEFIFDNRSKYDSETVDTIDILDLDDMDRARVADSSTPDYNLPLLDFKWAVNAERSRAPVTAEA